MDRQINIEEQRARMQDILRNCNASIIIALDGDNHLVTAYMNLNPIERRGLIELLGDTAPGFVAMLDDDDDDE